MRYKLFFILLLSISYGFGQKKIVIHFDYNSSVIRHADALALDSMLEIWKVRSGLVRIGLSGHCDNAGSDRYNDSLSLERVHAARSFLLSQDLPDSIFAGEKHYGSRLPLNDNGDPEKRQLNRRVEITFLSDILVPEKNGGPDHGDDQGAPVTADARGKQPIRSLSEAFSDTAALAGRNIVLHNMNFYGDRHVPLPESRFVLDQLLAVLRQHPALRIEIQGYICCYKDDKDGYDADTRTMDLSVQRAKFVYTWLVDAGISASRMSYRGFGASNKIYPHEKDEKEKMLNRRVEIKVLGP